MNFGPGQKGKGTPHRAFYAHSYFIGMVDLIAKCDYFINVIYHITLMIDYSVLLCFSLRTKNICIFPELIPLKNENLFSLQWNLLINDNVEFSTVSIRLISY